MIEEALTFFSIKNDGRCATYLDVAVEYIWSRYVELTDSPDDGDVYNEIVCDMLDDIDVHHYPLDVDF